MDALYLALLLLFAALMLALAAGCAALQGRRGLRRTGDARAPAPARS